MLLVPQDQQAFQSPGHPSAKVDVKTTSPTFAAVPIVRHEPNGGDMSRRVKSGIGFVADQIAAVIVPTVLFFSIAINVYYVLVFHNNVEVMITDTFASQKEWLFEAGFYGPLDENLVYAFMASRNPQASHNLTNALQAKPESTVFDPDTPCVALMGRDGGSVYALCDQPDKQRLPTWAIDFEALTIQTALLSSIDEFYSQFTKRYTAVFQAFPNERKGWLNQDTVKRLTCTTQELSKPVSGFQKRVLYTSELGVLTRVDCSTAENSMTKECRAIDQNPRVTLFDDQTGAPPFIDTYHVFESESGALFILHSYPSRDKIGKYTIDESSWPIDCCLYLRDGALGWFGVGYTIYTVQIPTIALIAKIELIVVISIIWLVGYRFNLRHTHHALYDAARMGVFGALVLQIVVSAYMEQDIMRSTFSWTGKSGDGWLLYFYGLGDVSMSVSLVALLLVRIAMEASLCVPGCNLSIIMGVYAAVSEQLIASVYYREQTLENGLQPVPTVDCARGFTSCSSTKFNYLNLVFIWIFVPVLVEIIRAIRLRRRRRSRASVSAASEKLPATILTSFERKCLDDTLAVAIVRDMVELEVVPNKRRQINADVICAAGFTIIHNRFLIRTKDLWLLVLAEFTPLHKTRDFSTIVWPLSRTAEGFYKVNDSKRVYVNGIRRIHIQKDQRASLICGAHHSLA